MAVPQELDRAAEELLPKLMFSLSFFNIHFTLFIHYKWKHI